MTHRPARSSRDEFSQRFDELAQIAYRVAYRLTGDREESRDIAQEALARAYPRWGRIGGYAEPWVARVASNLALGVLRRRHRGEADAAAVGDRTDQVVARMELEAALRRLSKRQRDVVVMRYVADLSEHAVARLLGCSKGTVKSHAHRGLSALRHSLGDDAPRLIGGTS